MVEEPRDCCLCGKPIDEKNGWKMAERFKRRWIPYCAGCQDRVYRHLASSVGYKLSMYLCAAAFDVPYLPEYFSEAKETEQKMGLWRSYLYVLKKHDRHKDWQNFSDGITDIKSAFSGEYDALEIDDEMLSDEEYQAGHLAQVKDWGLGPAERPYTQDDYDTLDSFYTAISDNRVNISAQAELAMRNISIMRLEQRRCLYAGDYGKAKQIEDMIGKEMESEQLRKKDELPQDRVRLDDIALACERAGLLGKSYDELCEILANHALHKTYPYTRDAADQMLLLIRNATAWNEGRMEIDRLPDELAMTDPLGEFAEKQDDAEKQIYKELQLSPLHMGE